MNIAVHQYIIPFKVHVKYYGTSLFCFGTGRSFWSSIRLYMCSDLKKVKHIKTTRLDLTKGYPSQVVAPNDDWSNIIHELKEVTRGSTKNARHEKLQTRFGGLGVGESNPQNDLKIQVWWKDVEVYRMSYVVLAHMEQQTDVLQ